MPGLHELTDPERARADGAFDGSCDLRVRQVQRRLRFDRTGVVELRHGLVPFGGKHLDLLLRRDQSRPAMLQLRGFFAQRRVGLLGALDGAGARFHEIVVTSPLLLREFQIGLGGVDLRGLLLDQRLLQFNLRIEVAHCGFRGRNVGVRLV